MGRWDSSSASGPTDTSATCRSARADAPADVSWRAALVEHLVGERSQPGRDGEAEQPRGRRVDNQLVLVRLEHGQLGRLRALEDAPDIDAGLTIRILQARAVAHQPAGVDKVAP